MRVQDVLVSSDHVLTGFAPSLEEATLILTKLLDGGLKRKGGNQE